jgi:hypothetical protein
MWNARGQIASGLRQRISHGVASRVPRQIRLTLRGSVAEKTG